jgi:type IV conjugative transfer system protein TraL
LEKNVRCPRYLHKPIQVLWWEADEFVIVMIFFTLALIFGYVFWLFLFAGPYIYTKFKRKYPRGFFKHLFWFSGVIKMKHYPSFFEKEFLE